MPTSNNKSKQPPAHRKPVVALIGRENVGKSTLFNALATGRETIVSNVAGTTRDRIFGDVEWRGETFVLIDTAGLAFQRRRFIPHIKEQVDLALAEADFVLFLVDAKEGVTSVDKRIAKLLRKDKNKVMVVVNKIDKPNTEGELLIPFYELGFETVEPIAAISGRQIGDMLDVLHERLDFSASDEAAEEGMHIAIVGKPNVGKSTLLNQIIGEKRSRTSNKAGTTRDTVHATLRDTHKDVLIHLSDTAGMRRKSRISNPIEKQSTLQSLKAINENELALIVFDATEPVSQQDMAIVRYAQEARKAMVLVVNKWDLVPNSEEIFNKFVKYFQHKLPRLHYVPIIFLSAETGENKKKLLDVISHVYENYHRTVDEETLAHTFEIISTNLGEKGRNKKVPLEVYSLEQVGTAPPALEIMINKAELLNDFHLNRIEKIIRQELSLEGTPVIIHYTVQHP